MFSVSYRRLRRTAIIARLGTNYFFVLSKTTMILFYQLFPLHCCCYMIIVSDVVVDTRGEDFAQDFLPLIVNPTITVESRLVVQFS